MSALYDVFISYCSKDVAVVRSMAEGLRRQGLSVWFDEWEIRQGDSSAARIEEGLQLSAVLVLCMSQHAFSTEWPELESQTFRFRDPLNPDRRFVPVRLDDSTPHQSLTQFLYIDWRDDEVEALAKLTRACTRPVEHVQIELPSRISSFVSLGHTGGIRSLAVDSNRQTAVSASKDGTARCWNLRSGACEWILEHHAPVTSVILDASGARIITGDEGGQISAWDAETGARLHTIDNVGGSPVAALAAHPSRPAVVAASKEGVVQLWNLNSWESEYLTLDRVVVACMAVVSNSLLLGTDDGSVIVRDLESGERTFSLLGHDQAVTTIATDRAGRIALTASRDSTVRVWDMAERKCNQVLRDHAAPITALALDEPGMRLISASLDGDISLRQLDAHSRIQTFRNGRAPVQAVAWTDGSRRFVAGSDDGTATVWDAASRTAEPDMVIEGQRHPLTAAAINAERSVVATASKDRNVRIWSLGHGGCVGTLKGHTDWVRDVAWGANSTQLVSASDDGTIRVWNATELTLERCIDGRAGWLRALTLIDDRVACATRAGAALWQLATGRASANLSTDNHQPRYAVHDVMEEPGYEAPTTAREARGRVLDLAAHPTRAEILCATQSGHVEVWDPASTTRRTPWSGHTNAVTCVSYSPDGTLALSGSDDATICVWDTNSGVCRAILEGHTAPINRIACDTGNQRVVTADIRGELRVWSLETGDGRLDKLGIGSPVISLDFDKDGHSYRSVTANGVMRVHHLEGTTGGPNESAVEYATYTNAKVLLVGESQAGKSGLAMRLAKGTWELQESTVGAWASHFSVSVAAQGSGNAAKAEREIWLWDFGGQADQRLIHQLYMADAAAAILVFDGQRDDAMARLWEWNRALDAATEQTPRLLAAGRIDCNPVRLAADEIDAFCGAAGFVGYVETSAKSDVGCAELRQTLIDSIDWQSLPWRSSPDLYRKLKNEILTLKDSGRAITSTKELRDWLPAQIGPFESSDLEVVVRLLTGPGAVAPLDFGDYLLLQPELINAYAQAVIQSLRDDPYERGCIAEERVLTGDLRYPSGFDRLEEADERIVLHAMHKQLTARSLCVREKDSYNKRSTVLVFPSFFRRQRPVRPDQPAAYMAYRFSGYVDDLYATLVVRLHHTEGFRSSDMWQNAADFKSGSGKAMGFRLSREPDGRGILDLYCEFDTPVNEQALFAEYVHDHLVGADPTVERLRTYVCRDCGTPVDNRDAARRRREAGYVDIGCSFCDSRIPLRDGLEKFFSSERAKGDVESLKTAVQIVLDNESRERVLVGEAQAIVARANQIARELVVSDHGIDMEVEFKTDDGVATGRKLYLQLKSGDSHLRIRKSDGATIFRIPKQRHADYWAEQEFPVMLVVRHSSGLIEWMEIRSPLRVERAAGRWPPKEIEFIGDRFDVMSVRSWRERVLGQ